MQRIFRTLFLTALAGGIAVSASAFTLMGPFPAWQIPGIGFNNPGGLAFADVGGPMNLGEGYRWNERVITYGFTPSFLAYFGPRGVDEINKAMAIFNSLPPMSKTSWDLHEYPLDTRRVNYQAQAATLLDLKSEALAEVVYYLGLTSPERYVWCLRARTTTATDTNYTVIMRNFDPVTWQPTNYINGVLYPYRVEEAFPAVVPATFSDAVERPSDSVNAFTSVASGAGRIVAVTPQGGRITSSMGYGMFYTGLTRDDVGGLRYLYNRDLFQVENVIPGTAAATSRGSPWATGDGGIGSTNAIVDVALRPGVDRIVFKQMKNIFNVGPIAPYTNFYTDRFVPLVPGVSQVFSQSVQRFETTPDILFDSQDIGVLAPGGDAAVFSRTSPIYVNESALAGTPGNGPGVIFPSVTITFNNIEPYNIADYPNNLDQNLTAVGWTWASFDGTTNVPYVYPAGTNILSLVH